MPLLVLVTFGRPIYLPDPEPEEPTTVASPPIHVGSATDADLTVELDDTTTEASTQTPLAANTKLNSTEVGLPTDGNLTDDSAEFSTITPHTSMPNNKKIIDR